MTYRLTIGDIEEVTLSNFLTDDLHTDYYEDDILKSRSSSRKWNNMILPLVIEMVHEHYGKVYQLLKVNCRLLLNCTCSPEYQWQLNADYAKEFDG
ncbi:hypothetical protein T01_4898 [Trichinella spiralis]|uniref:Uncharacterized protein n=1 Tax=Trichinella spiralis TaxID=6334 RepID=A0A0V1AN14_TRISP|nr:hypothetical protein T01_8396 [Trichinella spiralis]KRY26545.1 hypothetical protein T01_4898 [Trichinella spiralis]